MAAFHTSRKPFNSQYVISAIAEAQPIFSPTRYAKHHKVSDTAEKEFRIPRPRIEIPEVA